MDFLEVSLSRNKHMNKKTQVNNHVHSTFSFSPYKPEEIPVKAKQAGLAAVGLMDHDSVGGVLPFLNAARRVGIASTVGCEIRVDFPIDDFAVRRINNPDMAGNIYMSFHGIPASQLARCDAFLAPIRQAREERNRKQTMRLNAILADTEMEPLDYERDIRTLSQADKGGSVTERHILYALALQFINKFGQQAASEAACRILRIPSPTGLLLEHLRQPDNPYFAYDLMGLFKSNLVPRIYIHPCSAECMDVREAISFCTSVGAIPAYPYLGDVDESPTGDKAAQKFEDAVLEDLFDTIKKLGFQAVTYMPPRNTASQLARIRNLCAQYEFMEISGVDINTPRQDFRLPIMDEDEFDHLCTAAWALIAHEKLSGIHLKHSLFSPGSPLVSGSLNERLKHYAQIGKNLSTHEPEKSAMDAIVGHFTA